MKNKKKLEKIKQEISRLEKETPYNFCDRWCERCVCEKQIRCNLYLDELEQKLTCIAYGRQEDDPEITQYVMEEQFKDLQDIFDATFEEFEEEIDIEDIEDPSILEHIEFVKNSPLPNTTNQYKIKTHNFLKKTYYKSENAYPELKDCFEIISWYHTLLPVKIQRALAGFHDPIIEEDISLIDAIAQFQVCKKAITESIKAYKKILPHFPKYNSLLSEQIALLYNIESRIKILEENI